MSEKKRKEINKKRNGKRKSTRGSSEISQYFKANGYFVPGEIKMTLNKNIEFNLELGW